jgi:hypothetical protein
MSTPTEKSLVTDSRPGIVRAKVVLLEIGDRLHSQSNCIYDDACNIPARPKIMLRILLYVRRIQDRHRQGNDPNPDHLENPKGKELEEVIPLVIKSVVFPSLEDAEKEEA